MICALLLGRKGSSGFPGKNFYPVLGRPLAAYPLIVAASCPSVERVFVSTDSLALKELGEDLGAEYIERPAYLASKEALGEDAFVHGFEMIRERLAAEGQELELLIMLFANAATVTPHSIEEGIRVLREQPEIDSAVTVSSYNMWSPLRARRINDGGLLEPFVPFETFGDPKTLNCDRDSQGDVWYADMGLSIVRPHCLERMSEGLLPQKWMGQRIHPLKQWGGLDVDEPWQIPVVEAWLQAHDVDKLFQVRRLKWSHYYDSERTVLGTLPLNANSRVLDIGSDPGGLGQALKERFGVGDYTARIVDEVQGREARALNPEAKILSVNDPIDGDSEYDLVAALGVEDSEGFLDELVPRAYGLLAPGGSLVFTVRLTEGQTVEDIERSFQNFVKGNAVGKSRYVVRNTAEVISCLRDLSPKRIYAYGYSGSPASTAFTPFKTVGFVVFAVTRPSDKEVTELHCELVFPDQLLKSH